MGLVGIISKNGVTTRINFRICNNMHVLNYYKFGVKNEIWKRLLFAVIKAFIC